MTKEKDNLPYQSFDNLLEGIQIHDFNWKYIYVNKALVSYSHYSQEELMGYKLTDKYPGIEHTDLFKVLDRCMKERASEHFETEFIFPNGSKADFELSIQPVPEGLFILSINITDRKKAEREIKLLNENLEKKVSERTIELEKTITELKESEEQLAMVNKELEAFSYSISHDLRAPLRAINGYAKILEEDYSRQFNEDGNRVIQTIVYNAVKMGALIDDLLAFSKLGKKELKKEKIDLRLLLQEVITDLSRTLVHNTIIKFDKLTLVKADYVLLYQVMYNLVSNGIKYSSKKENPEIEISSEEKNGEVIVSVKDHGAGFDMNYVSKLFGVFQRLHREEEFEGTGVGLAIVQRIIAKHEGKVWAEGKVNEGATFYFSLPNN